MKKFLVILMFFLVSCGPNVVKKPVETGVVWNDTKFLIFNLDPGIYHGYEDNDSIPFLWGATYRQGNKVKAQWCLEIFLMSGAKLPLLPAHIWIRETNGRP